MEILSKVNAPLLRRLRAFGTPIFHRHVFTTRNIAECPIPSAPQASQNVISQPEIYTCLVPLYARGWEARVRTLSTFDGTEVSMTEGKVLLRHFSFNNPRIALNFFKDLVSIFKEEKVRQSSSFPSRSHL